MNEEYEEALYKSEIMCDRARVLFGLIFRLLCQRANITQDSLEERSKALKADEKQLIMKVHLKSEHVQSGLDQTAISRVVSGERWPSYDQALIWLGIIEDVFQSDTYKNERKRRGLPVYSLSPDLKVDLFRLAGFGTPDEIVGAYEKCLHMATEPVPRLSRDSTPRRPSRYYRRNGVESLVPQEEI